MHARRLVLALPLLALAAVALLVLPDPSHLLEDLADTLGAWTYVLVAGLAFLETGAFIGLIAPGETAIVLGGVVAASGGVSLPAVLAVAWIAAALGDLASFALGARLGGRFIGLHGPRVGMTAARVE